MMDAAARDKLNRGENVVPTKWFLAALDRDTGKKLWQQPLPSEPVYDGLCIARDGSVIVQLLDGGLICIGEKTKLSACCKGVPADMTIARTP